MQTITTGPRTREVREPEARPRRQGLRWPWLLVAATSVLGWLLAPAPWPAGHGELDVAVAGEHVVVPLELGAEEPLADRGVELPDGAPLDGRIEVHVAGDHAVGDVTVTLMLPDGRVEPVPVLSADGERVVAARRPVRDAAPVLALLGAVVVLWVSELLPLWVTSLVVPVVLATTRVLDATAALAPFFHPIIVLFLAGFLLAEAMRTVGLDETIATRIVALAGRRPVRLFVGFLVLAAGLSMFMSNTAAVAVLIPIALAVTAPLDEPGYRRTLVLGTAYAATIGGVGSAIGTPAGPLAITFLADVAGERITFLGWFAFGLPMLALFLPVLGWYLWRRLAPEVDEERFAAVAAAARAAAHDRRLSRDQATVLVVFVAIVAGWVTEPLHGVHIGIVALIGVVVLGVLGRVGTADLGRISWASLLTFGGGLTLGIALTATGVSDWIATRLGVVAGLPSWLAIAAVAAVALGLTTVASNTAAAAMFIPLAIPLAAVVGVDPVLLVVVVAIASSIDFALVIGTPPTMLAYATGLFTAREVLRVGSVLDLAGLVLLVVVVTRIWSLLGVVS
jgi:sodium-dependent dicarboxylate transporter 2/3/5